MNAHYKDFIVKTGQPLSEGGDGTAPEPYDLFLASISNCAGVHIVYFCESRNIPIDDISMTLHFERNETSHLMEKLPPGFPKKYKQAVICAAQMCTVEQNLLQPPEVLATTNGEL